MTVEKREWKTGDYAIGTVRGVPDVKLTRTSEGNWCSPVPINGSAHLLHMRYWHLPAQVTNLRRVYVLDITEDEARAVVAVWAEHYASVLLVKIAQQLRDQLPPAKPAIEEPPIDGTVVRLTGKRWAVRTASATKIRWLIDGIVGVGWSHIAPDVTGVLFEGVKS